VTHTVPGREIVGARILGIIAEHEHIDIAASDDDFLVGVGAIRALTFGKTGGRGEGIVLERRMVVVDAGIENGDFHAGSCIARAADRVPGCGDVHQIERGIQVALQGQQALHGTDSGQAFQEGRLFRSCLDEDCVQDGLNGACGLNFAFPQAGADGLLGTLDSPQAIGTGGAVRFAGQCVSG
jgi:hypothetical protein